MARTTGRRSSLCSARHWFRDYGVVGLVRPDCVRCGAPNPKITDQQRREYAAWRAMVEASS